MNVQTANLDMNAAFDALFAPWNRCDAPGMVVGIARHGDVLYRRAFGMASLETGVALAPATRMRIGSTSKHFTALLALLLAEDGLVDLDAPVRAYLPELAGSSGDPSIRQLLQHRGGVRCFLDLGFITHDMAPIPVGEALRVQARQVGRNFPPGETMLYSNGGYHIVSHALSRVAGMTFEDLLAQRIFAPLGMTATLCVPSDHMIVPGMATLHVPAGGSWRRGLLSSEDIRGEGGIVSTLDDMLRWAQHLYRRDCFGEPESWRALFELPVYKDGTQGRYALGIELGKYRGLATEHHAGGVIGGSCQLLRVPDHGISVIIIANGAPAADPTVLAEKCVDILLAEYLSDHPAAVDASPHLALLGDYISSETGMMYGLVEDGGALKGTFNGSRHPLPLTGLTDGRVVMRMTGLSDIIFNLPDAKLGSLPISFGMKTAVYRRLARGDIALSPEIYGHYWSADGDCALTIEQSGTDIRAEFNDYYGRSTLYLHSRALDFAAGTRAPADNGVIASLAFELHKGTVTGLRVSTARTRGLSFQRCQNRQTPVLGSSPA
jgi:D-aminopeptidase